ncbi:hypothetical protein Tco_0499401 [Tanacetum coccineum]
MIKTPKLVDSDLAVQMLERAIVADLEVDVSDTSMNRGPIEAEKSEYDAFLEALKFKGKENSLMLLFRNSLLPLSRTTTTTTSFHRRPPPSLTAGHRCLPLSVVAVVPPPTIAAVFFLCSWFSRFEDLSLVFGNTTEENVNHDKCDLEPINKELENSVAKLLYENERLCNEINHVKQDLKAQIQDKVSVITSLKNDIRKLKGKEIVENVVHTPSVTTISLGMFKLDLVSLPPRLLQNRDVHIDYLRHTQEQANTLRELVEQAKVKQPLDRELDFACKYATRIQELLVYVQDTCPNAITPSPKKVAVTPMNNVKKVRFVEPLTSSSNIKQVESSNTSDSNTPVLSSTGVNCSTNCGSKPPGNKKNDRISQTPSRNKKNKVEAQPRKVNKMNRVVKPVCDVDVKHSLSNANSEILCATCNKSMFDGVHDKCLLDLVQNGNNRKIRTGNIKNKIFGNLRVMYSLK